ncbi:MAG: hypothetical protein K2N94_13310 [Lachnospiraceae bacterium]|nr:hypothetical protein [Lachnospiraceae bacterium]
MRNTGTRKVVKLKKRKKINIGTIIFIFILLYLAGSIIYSKSKTPISICEVQEENLSRELTVTGVITRQEQLCYAQKEGYVHYYLQDGRRIKKDSTVYSIDGNRAVYDTLGYNGEITFEPEDMAEMKRVLSNFGNLYSGAAFDTVYSLKEELTAAVNEMADRQLLDNMQEFVASTGVTSSFQFVQADCTGMISYTSDSLDGLTVETVNSASFDQTNFTSASLVSSGVYAKNAPVYKVITSDEWQIVCPLTPEQYTSFYEKTRMKFQLEKDGFTFTAPVEFSQRGSEYYMIIQMTKYGANYRRERFLTLDIIISEETGLKIPSSAVINKDFYLVPPEYFTVGGDSNDNGLTIVTYNAQTGQPEYVFQKTDIYYQDEEYAYVNKSDFSSGTMIYSASSGESMPLAMIGTLTGAYNVNRGYAIFRRIELLEAGSDYIIIRKGTPSGLSVYDHIALNAENVQENSIIY